MYHHPQLLSVHGTAKCRRAAVEGPRQEHHVNVRLLYRLWVQTHGFSLFPCFPDDAARVTRVDSWSLGQDNMQEFRSL